MAAQHQCAANMFSLRENMGESIQQYFNTEIVPASERENYFLSKRCGLSDPELFPELSAYRQVHRAEINYCQELGVLSLPVNRYSTLLNNYNFTQKQTGFIRDQVRQEKADDFIFNLERISQDVPESHRQFVQFKQRSNYSAGDLAVFDALQLVLSDDRIDYQNGVNLLQEASGQGLGLGALLKVYCMYHLSHNNVKAEVRQLVNQLLRLDSSVLEVLDLLRSCEDNVARIGFI